MYETKKAFFDVTNVEAALHSYAMIDKVKLVYENYEVIFNDVFHQVDKKLTTNIVRTASFINGKDFNLSVEDSGVYIGRALLAAHAFSQEYTESTDASKKKVFITLCIMIGLYEGKSRFPWLSKFLTFFSDIDITKAVNNQPLSVEVLLMDETVWRKNQS